MPNKKASPDLKALPMLPHESVYIGVDIGKAKHVAGFVSKTLLERHNPRDAQRAAHSTEVASQARLILPFFLVKGVKYLYLMETEEQ